MTPLRLKTLRPHPIESWGCGRCLNRLDRFLAEQRRCRWCGAKCEGRRRSWCCDACVEEYLIQKGSWRAIESRDNGVCALCGLDCLRLERRLRRFATRWKKRSRTRAKALRVLEAFADGSAGRVSSWGVERSLWEADHIVPRSEGGVNHASNLRTLCIWCHLRETAELRRRTARRRHLIEAAQRGQPDLYEATA